MTSKWLVVATLTFKGVSFSLQWAYFPSTLSFFWFYFEDKKKFITACFLASKKYAVIVIITKSKRTFMESVHTGGHHLCM